MGGARIRLDRLLVERGVFETKAKAAAAIVAGDVSIGSPPTPARKPGQAVAADVSVDLRARRRFVSRGGEKLQHGLTELGIGVAGRRAIDVGASTGGFTDCLLKAGAAAVVAVDVGYGVLDWSLRQDPRVTVLERVNARDLRPGDIPFRPDFATVDVSFISLTKILPAVLGVMGESYEGLALVKPQFEAGREHVERGGVVRDAAARRDALVSVGLCLRKLGAEVRGFTFCGLVGPAGNRESFVHFSSAVDDGRQEGVDLTAAALGAEP